MKHYIFKVTLSGYGKTPEEAWDDAVETFAQDPGGYDDGDWERDPNGDLDEQLPEATCTDGSIAK
jgi:hypothetical protein